MILFSFEGDKKLVKMEELVKDGDYNVSKMLANRFEHAVRPDSINIELTFGIKDYNPNFWEEE